jgi:ABC-2 type transport system permease protein
MTLDWRQIGTVARREFLTTVRRKAFVLTLVLTPAYFAFVMWISSTGEMKERSKVLEELSSIGVVDSSGMFVAAEPRIVTVVRGEESNPFGRRTPGREPKDQSFVTQVRMYPDQASADSALRHREISQMVVISADYLNDGGVRRFARSSSLFSSADRRAVGSWLSTNLVRGRVDSVIAARVAKPTEQERLYTLNKAGQYELKDDKRELVDFMLPFAFSMLMGLCIIIGGQYLLQGVAEEKESRIMESLMCTISAEELMAGKLFGLGAVGLFVVAIWASTGLLAFGPALLMAGVHIPPSLMVLAVLYFLMGYLFFGSIMVGIGGVTNNMREAQQFSVWFTFMNFAPFIMITFLLSRPNAPVAVFMSMFPPTAASAMMLRMTAPSSAVPVWQIAGSLALLAAAGVTTLLISARVFRVGMLMYGKTPTLPEIVRWARQR